MSSRKKSQFITLPFVLSSRHLVFAYNGFNMQQLSRGDGEREFKKKLWGALLAINRLGNLCG